MTEPGRRDGAGAERGMSVSVLSAMVMPVLLLAGGLAVDGAQQARAARRAHAVAAAGARAGCETASTHLLAGQWAPSLVRHEALAAAGGAGAGQAGAGRETTTSVEASGQTVVVRVRVSRPTLVLSLVGVNQVGGDAEVSCRVHRP